MELFTAPTTALAREAVAHVQSIEHPAIFNHSMRVFHTAAYLSTQDGVGAVDAEALFYACVFHDSGTAEQYNGDQRFEVEGADAAARFLERAGWPAERVLPVWEAIALHTSPGIAERFGSVVRLTRIGVLADFGRQDRLVDAPRELFELLESYERLDVEEVLGRAVVAQALASPTPELKAPKVSWPASLLAGHLSDPDHEGINPGF